ncbi:MAG: hypothetical protein JWO73_590 [Candidatus Taylorbacteria bacterium]|nr:hypothetical protein [Candidatus Taylorbacteria bacterium]
MKKCRSSFTFLHYIFSKNSYAVCFTVRMNIATYRKSAVLLSIICAIGLILFSPFFCSKIAFAATDASADITQDTVWTKANSPYVVRDVSVAKGATLTVEPGVVVKFAGGFFNIYGNLNAHGTPEDHIYFTSITDDDWGGDTNGDGNSTVPKQDSWWGMTIDGSSTPSLSHIDLRYASNGIILRNASTSFEAASISNSGYGIEANSSSVHLRNYHAFDMYGDGIGAYSKSFVSVSSSTVENISQQSGILLFGSSTAYLDRVMIRGIHRIGIGLGIFGSSAIVSNSLIEGSDNSYDCGIYVTYDSDPSVRSTVMMSSSTIDHFSCGIGMSAGGFSIRNSSIQNNEAGISIFSNPNSQTSDIAQSSISNNSESGIENYAGMSIDARNNWWGDASGPFHPTSNATGTSNKIIDDQNRVQFSPWLTRMPGEKPTCCSNVLFIPGLEASSLFSRSSSSEKQLWVPSISTSIKGLYLDAEGKSLDPSVHAKDIISSTYGKDIYKTFIAGMDSLVHDGLINEWKAFPYDWRLDIADIAGDPGLINKIEGLASTSQTGKVTLLSHSNGGLISKMLDGILKKKNKESLIDKVIMVASPQLGTPADIGAQLHGDSQAIGGGVVVTARGARGLGINMPGAYGLLPQDAYFKASSDPIIRFDLSVDKVNSFRRTYGSSIASSSALRDFLLAKDGRFQAAYDDLASPSILKSSLFDIAATNHANIDSWIPGKDIGVYQIAGWGLPTVEGIRYAGKPKCSGISLFCKQGYVLDHKLLKSTRGDGTVTSRSAVATSEADNFYVNLASSSEKKSDLNHANILEAPLVQNLVGNIIKDRNDIALPEFVTRTEPVDTNSWIEVSVHSPVSLDMYDAHGNHTGLAKTQYPDSDLIFIDSEIMNSKYEEVGEGKYIYAMSGDPHTVKIQGQDIGLFSLELSETIGDKEVASTSFNDIPVSSSTKVSFDLRTVADVKELGVDIDGDGTVDQVVKNSVKPDLVGQIDFLMGILRTLGKKPEFLQDTFEKLRVVRDFLAKNNKEKSLKMLVNIETELSKTKEKKITADQVSKIIGIIEKIKFDIEEF